MKISLLLIAALLLTVATGQTATITGRIVNNDQPQGEMTVSAHATVDPGSPALAQCKSDSDGLYRLELPPGHYSLFARDAAGKLFAFFGRNPVEISDGLPLWAGLQAVPVVPPRSEAYDDPYSAALGGTLLFAGQPLSGATVTLYLDTEDDLKGQGYRMSLPTGEDGTFFFDSLPTAAYHLVARRHADGSRVGPVRDGDDLALYPGNPISLSAGRTTLVTLTAVRKIRETPEDATFSRSQGLFLTGTIVDREGKPQPGLHIFAYRDKVIGHKRPEAISPPAAADGSFRIAFPAPGIYYIGAREKYGDSPAPGELFGMYEGSADHGLEISSKSRNTPLRIIVEAVDLQ